MKRRLLYYLRFRGITPEMENQMDKKTGNEMETLRPVKGVYRGKSAVGYV